MRASQEELNLIKAAMDCEKNVRVFKRYQALYLFLSGKTCEEVAKKVFLKFLENLLSKNTNGKTVVVLDNARIHHAKVLQPFLKENEDRLQLMFLPPYSPNLNLIEGLWKWLKEKVIYNVFYKTVSEIRKNVNAFLETISAEPEAIIERLCLKLYFVTLCTQNRLNLFGQIENGDLVLNDAGKDVVIRLYTSV